MQERAGKNVSGILMQCPLIKSECEINFENGTVSVPFIKMTLDMMRTFCKHNNLYYTFDRQFQ